MEITTLIVPFILIIFSLIIIAGVSYFLFSPLYSMLIKNKVLSRFSNCLRCLDDFDSHLQNGNVNDAIKSLQMAPFLDIPNNSQLLNSIKDHHQELLARYVSLADLSNVRATNIATLDSLFNERNELLSMIFKTKFSYEALRDKRIKEGKTIPDWTKSEFTKKESDIKDSLRKNFENIRIELEIFYKNLESAPRGETLIH